MNKLDLRLPFGIPRDLAVLAAAMLFWGLGEGLFIFFYPLSLQYWKADSVQIGAILSMLGVAMALVQVPAGYLSDQFGSRPLIRAAMILGVIAAVAMALAPSLGIFIIGLVAYSLTSFIGAPLNSYISGKRKVWSPQRAMTFISGSFQVGAIIGPILGGLIGAKGGFSAVFKASAVLFVLATLIAFTARKQEKQETEESTVAKVNPFRNLQFLGLLVIIFFTIFAISTPQQLTSLYLQEQRHLTLQQIGMTGTFAGIGTAVIMFTLGNLHAPIGMVVGQVFIGLFALLMWRGESAAVFYSGYLFIGGYRLYRSMALAAARPLVKATDVGLAFGLVETGNALAVILAPLAAGFLYAFNPVSVYTVSLVFLVIMATLTAFLLVKRRKITTMA
jgi:MFS family permease